ncbi:MAG: VOC family protein [Vicinamibacterales bacterium]
MAKVRPVPKGYHTVTAGLSVKDAGAFIKFCKKAFGAKEVERMTGPGGGVMHAELIIGDSRVMCGDEMPSIGNKSAATLGGTPVQLYLQVEDCDRVFKKALAAGATVRMPLENMFWGDRMGSVVDPFGNTWGVATRIENVSPAEMKKRAKKWMAQMAAPKTT